MYDICNFREKGVKQGDSISPTMFDIFINDLVIEINSLDLGISIGERRVSLLLYADDIVFTASSENDLQTMLNTLTNWCRKWRVLINTSKSMCMLFDPNGIEERNISSMLAELC